MFIDLPNWRSVDINQDLLAGDVLRTNANGHLAVLFADNTQIRLARNTTLLVKQIGAAADTLLGLEAGTIWARAERGGEGLTIETPAAAAAIRGTDWTMTVDGAQDLADRARGPGRALQRIRLGQRRARVKPPSPRSARRRPRW